MAATTTANKLARKAKSAASKAGKVAISNPKTTLYAIGGIAVLILGYKLWNTAKKAGETLSGDNIDNNIPVTLNPNYSRTTISSNTARNYASQLLEAMNWKGFMLLPYPHYGDGTDTDVLKSIFNTINSEDFKLIYNEFGKKDYNGTGSPPKNTSGGIQDALGISEKRNLVYWLRSELDFLDFSLKSKVRAIVEGAGLIF